MFLANALSKRANLENPDTPLIEALTSYGTKAYTGKHISPLKATQLSVVFGIMKVFAESATQLPLKLMRVAKDGSTEQDLDDPRGQLLRHRVNPHMRADTFRSLILYHCLGWGNFYAEIQKDPRTKAPIALWALDPERVRRYVKAEGDVLHDVYLFRDDQGNEQPIPRENMLHIMGPSFNGWTGLNPLIHFVQAAAIGLALEEYTGRFAANDMTPAGILFNPKSQSADKQAELLKGLRENFGGLENKHRIGIMAGGEWKYQQTSIDPAASELLASRKFENSEFCRAFRCPPHMVAILDDASYNNITVLDIGFVKHSLNPWLQGIERALVDVLFDRGEQDSWRFEHIPQALLRADPEKEAKVWETYLRMGVFNPDEVRTNIGRNPRGDGLGGLYLQSVQHGFALDIKAQAEKDLAEGSGDTPPDDDSDDDEGRALELRERAQAGEWSEAIEAEVRKQTAGRQRILESTAFRALMSQGIGRILSMEARKIRAAAKKHLKTEGRDAATFRDVVKSDLRDLEPAMAQQIRPTLHALGDELRLALRDELAIDDDQPDPPSENFTRAFAEGYAARHVRASLRELETDLESDGDSAELVEARLGRWAETRLASDARDEHRRFGHAVSKVFFGGWGFTRSRWTALGKNCPICKDLNGRVARNNESFGQPGETLGDGFKLKKRMGHPPAHGSCDCLLVAMR